jgi:threonine/homoserine efflux transporter RhtA
VILTGDAATTTLRIQCSSVAVSFFLKPNLDRRRVPTRQKVLVADCCNASALNLNMYFVHPITGNHDATLS